MKKQFFRFSTQYNQFYIEDKGNKINTNSPNFWTEEAFKDRLAIGEGIIAVGTQSYGNIKGEIEVLDKPNTSNINYNLYDHIVEGGINVKSGELQILDSPNNQLELSLVLNSGKYRVRIYSSNLASVEETDLESDKDNDYYRIELWKDENMDRKVLKQYQNGR